MEQKQSCFNTHVYDRTWKQNLIEKVIEPETRFVCIDIMYCVFFFAIVMHHAYVMLYLNRVVDGSDVFLIPWLIFALISILLGRMWKDKVFWILLVLSLLRFLRLAIPSFQAFLDNKYGVVVGIYAFFGCYAVARVLGNKSRRLFVHCFCAVWTVLVVFVSILGLYAAWTGQWIYNLGGWKIDIYFGRLRLFYYPVTSGLIASTGIGVALIGICLTKSVVSRALYIMGLLTMLMAETLTGARISYCSTAFEISALFVLMLFYRQKTSAESLKTTNKIKIHVLALCFMAIAVIVLIYLQIHMVDWYNSLHVQLSTASGANVAAAGNEATVVAKRGMNYQNGMDDFFTGRLTTWKQTFQFIRQNPRILLYGHSVKNVMSGINTIRANEGMTGVAHCHNVLLQTLLEDGLPGLFLYISILLIFVKRSVQLLINRTTPIWIRMMPLPVIACLIGEIVDNTTHVNSDSPQMTIMYLFMGMTIVYSSMIKYSDRKI